MGKEVQGECNRCGHCGCYAGAGGPAKWYPGIGAGTMNMQYHDSRPQLGSPILYQLIAAEFEVQYDRPWESTDTEFALPGFRISGGGPPIIKDIYVSTKGIHISATDFSCPWFQLGNPNECLLWGRDPLPQSCAIYPQTFHMFPDGEDRIAKWEVNHPPCGYYWIDV